MKRLFLLGVVATAIFSMAACSNDDMSVDINARRAERPREVTVSTSADGSMVAVSWVAGRDAGNTHEVVGRLQGSDTIASFSGQYVTLGTGTNVNDFGYARLPLVNNNIVRGGSLTFSGNTLVFEQGNLDRFAVVVALPFAAVGGAYEIGVRSGHFDSIEGMSANSDIRWVEGDTRVTFGAMSAFNTVSFTQPSDASINIYNNANNNRTTEGDINLVTATGISGQGIIGPAGTRLTPTLGTSAIIFQVQDSQTSVWTNLLNNTVLASVLTMANDPTTTGGVTTNNFQPVNFRAIVHHGNGLNTPVTSQFTITRAW